MRNKDSILKEIQTISPLIAEISKNNVFTVPEDYFFHLSDNIKEKTITSGIREFSAISMVNTEVPDGYFDNLSKRILNKIQQGKGTSTVLESLGKENVFATPEGYFERFPEVVINKLKEDKKARIIPIYKKSVFKYAIAAMVAVVLFIGTLLKTDKPAMDSFAIVNNKTVTDRGALKYNSQSAFDDGLASLTNEQIISYLDSHNTMMSDDQITNSANTVDMPELLDYLSDENTLEKYLNSILDEEVAL